MKSIEVGLALMCVIGCGWAQEPPRVTRFSRPVEVAPPSDEKVLQIYAVGDLVAVPALEDADLKGAELGGADPGGAEAAGIKNAPKPTPHVETRGIQVPNAEETQEARAQNLRRSIVRFSGYRGNERDIQRAGASSLAVSATPADHKAIQKFLEFQRQNAEAMIDIESRILTIDSAVAKKGGFRPGVYWLNSNASATAEERKHTESAAKMMRAEKVDVLTAPRLMSLSRQSFQMMAINQVSYVAGFDVHHNVEPHGATIVDPRIGILNEGILVAGRALALDNDRVGLIVDLQWADLKRPMKETETVHGFTISIPQIETMKVSTESIFVPGKEMLYVAPTSDDKRWVGIMIKAKTHRN